ncbi:MAG TPA: hypothetical protein VM901_02785 [Bdellovibrionota bacterium]|jgi:hypothetical protein|nr:hypothetical protein [Bdellovibrionota bacterium]
MKNAILVNSLLMASLAVLSACGGDNKGGNTACYPNGYNTGYNNTNYNNNNYNNGYNNGGYSDYNTNCNTVAPTGGASGDYMLKSVIPMLQQTYGNVVVPYDVPVMDGLTMKRSNQNGYSWATLYNSYVLGAINKSGCRISGASSNVMSPFGTLNYGCFQNKMGNYMNTMNNAYVQFANTRYQYYSFFEIFNWFLGTGSSYYQNSYYPSYGGGTNYYQPGYAYYNPSYCYDPYWGQGQGYSGYGYGYGAYQAPYYSNNGQYYISIGFSGSL